MKAVIKIGTNILTKDGQIDKDYIKDIARQVSMLKGHQLIIVTSGAIGFGCMKLGLKQKPREINMKQALAAIGQNLLMHEYEKSFSEHGINIAQILLTYDVFTERKSNLNLKNCLDTLLGMGIIPIINENDVTSIDEIGTKFGDNDKLSALVASKVSADLLVILTDVDGLYDKHPKFKDARKIAIVDKITKSIEDAANSKVSSFSTGGMKTKVDAAKIATAAGCNVIITYGREPGVVRKSITGERTGTLFLGNKRFDARRRWILEAKPKGKIIVNEGAEKMLKHGKSSLLPVGITSIEGNFKSGDIVMINDFAKAETELGSLEIAKIKGLNSKSASAVLGRKIMEIAKRENIVFIKE